MKAETPHSQIVPSEWWSARYPDTVEGRTPGKLWPLGNRDLRVGESHGREDLTVRCPQEMYCILDYTCFIMMKVCQNFEESQGVILNSGQWHFVIGQLSAYSLGQILELVSPGIFYDTSRFPKTDSFLHSLLVVV